MTSVRTGRLAEQAAAEFLTRQGYGIVEQNYRKPHCEIDIVARLDDTIYFVEVKYRSTDLYGRGFEYITDQKLRHMERAAATWVRERQWRGEHTLSVVEVGGSDYEVQDFIESLH